MWDIEDQLLVISCQYLFYHHREALAEDRLHKNYVHTTTSKECMMMNSSHLDTQDIP